MKTNKLLLSTAAFGLALTFAGTTAGTTNVFADEQNSETPQEKSTLQTLEEEVASLKNNQSSIKIRLTNIAEKKAAKAQTLTVQSQLDASEVKLEKQNRRYKLKKTELPKRSKRLKKLVKLNKLKQKRNELVRRRIETGKPVASNIVPSYTPHANSYPWGQCTWGVKVLAPWVGDIGVMLHMGCICSGCRIPNRNRTSCRVSHRMERWWLWSRGICYRCPRRWHDSSIRS